MKWNEHKKMEVLDENELENENWRKFVVFYRQVLEDELEFLSVCEEGSYKMAMRCGLVVLASHSRRGYGTQLIEESDNYLKELGYEYVLVHATNKYSQSIFSKQGYIPVHTYNLEEWSAMEGTAMNMLKLL